AGMTVWWLARSSLPGAATPAAAPCRPAETHRSNLVQSLSKDEVGRAPPRAVPAKTTGARPATNDATAGLLADAPIPALWSGGNQSASLASRMRVLITLALALGALLGA